MSFLLPAQDEATRRKRGRWIAGVVVVVCAVGLGWSPVWNASKRAHARKLIAEAEAYAAQNRTDAALSKATEAFRKGGGNRRVLRLLLELHGEKGEAQAFAAWGRLARLPEASFEDRRELLKWAVAWGQAGAADQQWLELQKEQPLSAETLRIGAAYFEMRGDAERAVRCARETLVDQPEDIETRILLGRVLTRNGSAADRALGRRLLREQAGRPDALGLQVLRHLAGERELTPFEAQESLVKLAGHPLRKPEDALAVADLSIQVTPYKRAAILRETAHNFAGAGGGGDLARAGRWLLNHEAFEEVLELIPIEKAREQTVLGLLHLDALTGLQRWSEVERILGQNSTLVEAFEASLYRARAATRLGQGRLAELHWRQALENADKNPTDLLTLAAYARTEQSWEAAERALRILAEQTVFQRRACEELVSLRREQGAPNGVREVLREMREKFPDDPVVENDLAYLDLLENQNVQQAAMTAEKLIEKHPHLLAYRVTLALGRFRQGQTDKARTLLDIPTVNWAEAAPGHRAVFAAVLNASGETARARELSQALERLQPQERALVARIVLE